MAIKANNRRTGATEFLITHNVAEPDNSRRKTGLARPISLAPMFILPDRYHQSVGIRVLGNPSPKNFLGLLKTRHFLLDHLAMELVKIRNPQTRPAASRR